MKIGNQPQVIQLNQNQGAQATNTGSLKDFFVSIGKALGKVGHFFKETLPNFFKGLSQRNATTAPPEDRRLNEKQGHGLSQEELRELHQEFELFNNAQIRLETDEQASILEKDMDKEVVILEQPRHDHKQVHVNASSDPFAELEHSLKNEIASNKKNLETEADNVLRHLEFDLKSDESVTVSPQEMDKFISNAAKKLHGDREFSQEDVNQLIHDLGGPLTNDEKIENAALKIAGKQDFSLNDLEKLMQDLSEPTVEQKEPQTLPQESKKNEPMVSLPRQDFLPRPTGNPFEKFKIHK